MANQKLAQWIKAKESQGYSEEQLRNFLTKKGFKRQDIDEALGSSSKKSNLDFWDKIKYIFSEPMNFFENIKSEKGIKDSFIMFAIVTFSVAIIQFGTYFLMTRFFHASYLGLGILGLIGPAFIAIGFALSLAMSFVYSGIVHLIVMAFKGSGSYSETYKAYAYSMVPALIIAIIPLIGFFGFIYSLVLMVIGVAKLQKISFGKSAIAVLAPIALILGLLLIFIIYLLSNIRFLF